MSGEEDPLSDVPAVMEEEEAPLAADYEDATAAAARETSQRLASVAVFNDLESKYQVLHAERETLRSTSASQAEEISSLQRRTSELQSTVSAKDVALAEAQRIAEEERSKRLAAEGQEKNQRERTDRVETEADELRAEISRLTETNKASSTKLAELQTESSLSTSSVVPLQYELDRVRKEMDSLSAHSAWLETELASRSEQIASLKTSHSAALLDLQSRKDSATAEKDELNAELTSLRGAQESARAKLDKLNGALRDKESEAADAAHAFEEELIAERRLVSLSKEKAERAEARYEAIRKDMETMKRLADEAAAESMQELERIRSDADEHVRVAVEEAREDGRRAVEELEGRVQEAEEARRRIENDLLGSPTPLRRRRRRLIGDGAPAARDGDRSLPAIAAEGEAGAAAADDVSPGQDGPMSLTDLYERLAETEDELHAERTERKKQEIYLRRIQLEIESKTPQVKQRQREYEIVVDQLEETKGRLGDALQEIEVARAEAHAVTVESQQMEKECRELRKENSDLATQVQALLRSRMGNVVDHGSSSDDIVEFDSLERLQEQNQRLLREHRRLMESVSDLENKIETDPIRTKLAKAESELARLREEREKQSKLVAGIVQQRDLYRALVAKADSQAVSDETGNSQLVLATAQVGQQSELEAKNHQLSEEVSKLRVDLASAQNEKAALEERLARLDEHCSSLTASVDSLQSQLSAANAATARSEADSSYNRERCKRLEESLEVAKREVSRGGERRKELDTLNLELQKSLSEARAETTSQEQHLRQAEVKLRLAETQVQTARAAESRMTTESNSMRSELARQGALLDSVQRIEASLSAKTAAEQQRVGEEMARQAEMLATERSKHSTEVERLEGRISDLELRAKELENKKDEALAGMVQSKEDASSAKSEAQSLSDKCAALEKDLMAAKRKLGETTETGEEVMLQEKMDLLTAELDGARTELATAKERIADYQDMAKESEKNLTELTNASDEYKKRTSAEIEKLKSELSSALSSNKAKQDALEELGNDLTSSRAEQEKVVADLNGQIANLRAELETAKKDAEATTARVESFTAEIKEYRADATMAQNNYERELALHASARTALRTARAETEAEMRLRQTAESQLDAFKAEALGEKKALEEAKAKLEDSLREMEARLEESRNQNKVLHSQMATLTESVEKYQAEKLGSLVAEGTPSVGGEDGSSGFDELASLRKTVSDLREVVRFMQSERDMFEAQLESAKRTAERERVAAAITKRSLDEARAELEVVQGGKETPVADSGESTSGPGGTAAEDTRKLKQAEEQLTLLRESNALLREESEKNVKMLADVQKEVDELKKASEPTEERNRELEVDKAALEAEKASLVREVEAWKGRVQSLVSKFHQIDPEEHAKVLASLDAAKKEMVSLKTLKGNADKDCAGAKALVSRLNKEVSQQKMLVESTKKALAKATSEKDALTKSSLAGSKAEKERDQLKKVAEEKEKAVASAKTELAAANGRVENLRKILRKYKTNVEDMKKQLASSKSSEKEAKEALAKVKESQKDTAKEKEATPASLEKQAQVQSKKSSATVVAKAPAASAPSSSLSQPPPPAGVTENREMPQAPSGGFKFAPSSVKTTASTDSSKFLTPGDSDKRNEEKGAESVKSMSTSGAKAAVEPGTEGTTIKIESSATSGAAGGVATKTKAEATKENAMRAKLMKRKRQLEEGLKKAEEEKAKEPAMKKKAEEKKVVTAPTTKATTAAPAKVADVASSSESKPINAAKGPGVSAATPNQNNTATSEGAAKQVVDRMKAGGNACTASKEDDSNAAPVAKEPKGTSEKKEAPSLGAASTSLGSRSTPGALAFGTSAGVLKFGSGTKPPTFGGSSTFPKPSESTVQPFGSSVNLPSKSQDEKVDFGASTTTAAAISAPAFGGGAFLNLTPPGQGSTPAAPLTFGSSASIKLPLPTKKSSPVAAPKTTFGMFGQGGPTPASPFGGFGSVAEQAKPLFGGDSSKKRSIPSGEDSISAKVARTEKEEEGPKEEKTTKERGGR